MQFSALGTRLAAGPNSIRYRINQINNTPFAEKQIFKEINLLLKNRIYLRLSISIIYKIKNNIFKTLPKTVRGLTACNQI